MLSDNTLQDKDVSPPSKDTISSAWTVLSEGSVLSDNTCKDTDVSPAWVGPSKRNIPSTRSQEDTRLVSSKPPIPSVDTLEDKDLSTVRVEPSKASVSSDNAFQDNSPTSKATISSDNTLLYEDNDVSPAFVVPDESSILSGSTCADADIPSASSNNTATSANSRANLDRSTARLIPASSVNTYEGQDLSRKWAVPSRRAIASAKKHKGKNFSPTLEPLYKHSFLSANTRENEDASVTRMIRSRRYLRTEDKSIPPVLVLPIKLDPHGFHELKSSNQEVLANIPSEVCAESGETHTMWSDVQLAYEGIDHLVDRMGCRVLFAVKPDGEL